MEAANLLAAWIGILLGMASGAAIGLGFARPDFLGGYDAWPRRLVRLAHISLFGLAFLNLAFVVTAPHLDSPALANLAGPLFILGAIAMPIACLLAAARKSLKWTFAFPVLALAIGASLVTLDTASQLIGGAP